MRVLDKPTSDSKDVFLKCVSRVRSNRLKARLESVADLVEVAANEFDQCGVLSNFYNFNEHDDIGGIVSGDEMRVVYESRMARKGSPGRQIYDKLRASSPHDICPLCGHRQIKTLDHYLPKSKFPSLAVVLPNLIPACSDCNKSQLAEVPVTAEDQTIHPYYDDISSRQWLFARVVEGVPASITFYVRAVDSWSQTLNSRVEKHFNVFELSALYISQAGTELANLKFQLRQVYKGMGAEGVQVHLHESYRSYSDNHVNSWQTAMYQALAGSYWFCDGGFIET